jgi:ribose 5-phosphate isomerase A
VVIADESKLVSRLGAFPLPVEVLTFGHGTTRTRICAAAESLGYANLAPALRMKNGQPSHTDNGNLIYDCPFGAISDAPALAASLSMVVGVVDHGLFVNMASALVIAAANGVRVIERRRNLSSR